MFFHVMLFVWQFVLDLVAVLVFWLHHTSVRNQAKKSWQFDHSHTVKLARMYIML